MWELDGPVQHYAWGSPTALPEFLGRTADGAPWAELWLGAHPLSPARIVPAGGADDAPATLEQAIAADPQGTLGDGVVRAFGERLPYLLKVIAPERPLSLQVHPTREHAAESFAAENAAGLPMDAALRNYRDDNHKPEMLVALTRFTALCGFRTPRKAASLLAGLGTEVSERLHGLLQQNPTAHGMRAAFRMLVTASMRPDASAVAEVVEACRRRLEEGRSPSPRIDRTVQMLAGHHPGDPGVVAALLLNPVTLEPGEAMFVPVGALHAYLHGVGVEVMAASDNVLRAGLTDKKIDAEEMLQCVSVAAAPPLRVAPERQSPGSVAYYAPVDDFELSVTHVWTSAGAGAGTGAGADAGDDAGGAQLVPGGGPRTVLCLDGEVELLVDGGRRSLAAGRAVFVPASAGPLRVRGAGRLVQASVP